MTTKKIELLDHGYVEFIEHWGSDERIVEAARMSTNKGFLGWGPIPTDEDCELCDGGRKLTHVEGSSEDFLEGSGGSSVCMRCKGTNKKTKAGDERLLGYLYRNKHSTPFEMAGMVIEVQTPIFVLRQWHRHRTQCLAPDTLVHFESPKGKTHGRKYVYKMRIEDVWKKWQPTVRKDRPERQTNAHFKRDRIKGMLLRCLDEETGEILETHIVDVIKGDPKPMVRVTTTSGKAITATREHRFFTNKGWSTLGDAIENKAMLVVEGTTRAKTMRWERPEIDEQNEEWKPIVGWESRYEVSNEGRVRRIGCKPKRSTAGSQGYDVVSLSAYGKSYAYTVHRLVLEAFVGPCPEGQETLHENDNRGDPRLSNLSWGTPKKNAHGRVSRDRQRRLISGFEEIVLVEEMGELPTYDLSVEDPWHNFVADGFVVHNSYNEMSARYTPLPDVNYLPTVERCITVEGSNKQAGKKVSRTPTHEEAIEWLEKVQRCYDLCEETYQDGLEIGIPKEVARIPIPVARYSRMRASANLRNWLAFLTLRADSHAQEEIRVFAEAVGTLIQEKFPRTWELFVEGRQGV